MKAASSPPSLSKVLVFTLLLASAMVWAAIYGVGMALMHWPESGGFDRQLITLAQGLRKVAEAHGEHDALKSAVGGVSQMVAEFAGDIARPEDVAGFNIWSREGVWIMGSPNLPRVRMDSSSGFRDADIQGETYRVYTAWTADQNLQIDVMQTRRGRRADFNGVMLSRTSIVAPLLVGFPLLLLPVLFVVRCGLKPLRQLSDELAARKPDDLSPIALGEMVAELRPVAVEINGTLAKLDALLRRERDFLADAAHELRTPLAVISAQAEDVVRSLPLEQADAGQELRSGLDRANRLVGQLLTLARFEARADDMIGPADVADIIRDGLAVHARDARAKSIQLSYDGPDRLPIPGAGHAIAIIVGNLVSNAVRYGREGGQARVSLCHDAPSKRLRLTVCDDGPGIPPEQRPRIFERFHRVSQTQASGSGLGLAIVASAARQIGASIDVAEGLNGQGICFSVVWHAERPEPVLEGA